MTNTLNDQLLENVHVEMEEAEGFTVLCSIPTPKLSCDQPATTYTLVQMDTPNSGMCVVCACMYVVWCVCVVCVHVCSVSACV